jgi:hypothetical protein
MDVQGVTRPEAPSSASADVASFSHAPQAMMVKAAFRGEAMGASPVEGEGKVVGATVSMKLRF